MTQANFKFVSDATGGDQFTVLSFTGTEAISTLYQYQIEIKAPLSAAINLDDVLDNPARFITKVDDKEQPVYGMLSNFEELQTVQGSVHYKAVLVPHLWALSNYKTNEIYTQEKTVDKIIETVMENADLYEGTDFDLNSLAKGHLLSRDYVCQFGESDLDFISRLLENEGIFYYFDQSGDAEKIIFINDMNYEAINRPGLIFDLTPSTKRQYDSLYAWSCRKQRLAGAVTVRDFNPVHPALDISDTSPIDKMSLGTEYLYGENIKDEDEASYLSEIRAEESLCNKTRYYGEGSVTRLRAGYLFEMEMHPNENYNGVEYLAIEVNHEGLHLDMSLSSATKETIPQYRNSFVAIEASEQYRPARITPKPRFYGTMTAFIFAETGKNIAEIDEFGRYRVHLPFDRADGSKESTDPDRKASTWIRKAQDYVGESKGSFFPLTGGTEVLLSFINGDPDQPIIIGAVPNASEPSLMTADNETESIVQTGSGNKIRMGDVEGEDRIVMQSPTANSWLRVGTPNDPDNFIDTDATDGIKFCTDGTFVEEAGSVSAEHHDFTVLSTWKRSDELTNEYKPTIIPEHKVTDRDPAVPDTSVPTPSALSDSAKRGVHVDGHDESIIEGSYILHAQNQYGAANIRFEMLDDRVVLDTGGRDFYVKCNHYDLDNSSEDNVTDGHDYAKHFGTTAEEFYGASRSHFFGESFETFVGAKQEISLANASEIFVGAKQEFALAKTIEVFVGEKNEFYIAAALSLGTGITLDLNFAGNVVYTPWEMDLKDEIEAHKTKVKAESNWAEIKTKKVDVEVAKVKLANRNATISTGDIEILQKKLALL